MGVIRSRAAVCCVGLAAILLGRADGQDGPTICMRPLAYPPARLMEQVDSYHGVEVQDPYRWLEAPTSEETRIWIQEQNKLTQDYLAAIDEKESIRERLTRLWDYVRTGVPVRRGDYYFFTRHERLQAQDVFESRSTKGAPCIRSALLEVRGRRQHAVSLRAANFAYAARRFANPAGSWGLAARGSLLGYTQTRIQGPSGALPLPGFAARIAGSRSVNGCRSGGTLVR